MDNFHLMVICVLVLIGKSNARLLNDEPMCLSNYDFHERVLEKLLRMEHKMDLYEEKMSAMVAEVNKESDKYEENMSAMVAAVNTESDKVQVSIDNYNTETLGFRTEIGEMKETLANMARRNDLMTKEAVDRDMIIRKHLNDTAETTIQLLNDTTETTIKLLNDTTETTIKYILDKLETPAVAFTARTVSNRNPSDGERLIFTYIVLNKGDAYDATTGVFTATVPGIYIFSVQLSATGAYVDAQIVKNSDINIIGTVRSTGTINSWYKDNTGFGIGELDIGDTVFVRKYSGSANALFNGNDLLWSSFSGTLVTEIQ